MTGLLGLALLGISMAAFRSEHDTEAKKFFLMARQSLEKMDRVRGCRNRFRDLSFAVALSRLAAQENQWGGSLDNEIEDLLIDVRDAVGEFRALCVRG